MSASSELEPHPSFPRMMVRLSLALKYEGLALSNEGLALKHVGLVPSPDGLARSASDEIARPVLFPASTLVVRALSGLVLQGGRPGFVAARGVTPG